MIVQYNKKLNYTKPTDLFNYIIDTYKDDEIRESDDINRIDHFVETHTY